MAYGGGQLDEFARTRREGAARRREAEGDPRSRAAATTWPAIEFAQLLNHAVSAHAGLNQEVVSGIIDQRVYDSYVTILAPITASLSGA